MRMRQVVFGTVIVALMVSGVRMVEAQGAAAANSAKGSFTVSGKTYPLTHAAAFVDASDSRKPVILVLTDKALPAKALTTSSVLSFERSTNPFSGIALWLDDTADRVSRRVLRERRVDGDERRVRPEAVEPAGEDPRRHHSDRRGGGLAEDVPTTNVTFSATLK